MNGVTNGLFYMKLALQNIKKNAQTYVPYILTCIGSVMMFDIILTLADNKEIAAMHGGSDMRTMLYHCSVHSRVPVLHKQLPDETQEEGNRAF